MYGPVDTSPIACILRGRTRWAEKGRHLDVEVYSDYPQERRPPRAPAPGIPSIYATVTGSVEDIVDCHDEGITAVFETLDRWAEEDVTFDGAF